MSVTSLDTDYDNLTTTLVADFDASVDEVWQLWADPRKLERWWGPPTYPSTFEKHDLSPGGEVTFYMTGPEGDQPRGWWRVTSVDPPTSLRFTDGFANEDGTPTSSCPWSTSSCDSANVTAAREWSCGRPRSREELDKLVGMGMLDGLEQAVGQMDALLGSGTRSS